MFKKAGHSHPVCFSLRMTRMSQEEQQDAFALELDKLIDRFVMEFDLTVSSAIGVLETAKMQLFMRETTDEPGEGEGA